MQIELIDCTVVLGNLLDNAIEACLKLEEAKRRIEVSVLRDEAYADGDAKLYVSIINTSLPVHIEKDCTCHNEIGTASARLWSALCQRAAAPQQRLLHDGLS